MAALNKLVVLLVLVLAEEFSILQTEASSNKEEPVCVASQSHPGVFLANDCRPGYCQTTQVPSKGFNCSISGYGDPEEADCKNHRHFWMHDQWPTVDEVCLPLLTRISQYMYTCPELHTYEKAINVTFQLPICDAESAKRSQGVRVIFSANTKHPDNYYAQNPVCRIYNYSHSNFHEWNSLTSRIEVWDRCLGIGLQSVFHEKYYYLSLEVIPTRIQLNYTIKFRDVDDDSLQLLAGAWKSRREAQFAFQPIQGINKYLIEAKSEDRAWSFSQKINVSFVTIPDIPNSSNIVTVTVSPNDSETCKALGYKCSPIMLTLIDKNFLNLPADSPVPRGYTEDKMDWRHTLIITSGIVIAAVLITCSVLLFRRFQRSHEYPVEPRQVLWISETTTKLTIRAKKLLKKTGFAITCAPQDNTNSMTLMKDHEIIIIVLDLSAVVSGTMEEYLLDIFQSEPLWERVKVVTLAGKGQHKLPSEILPDLFNRNHRDDFLKALDDNTYKIPEEEKKLIHNLKEDKKTETSPVRYHRREGRLSIITWETESLISAPEQPDFNLCSRRPVGSVCVYSPLQQAVPEEEPVENLNYDGASRHNPNLGQLVNERVLESSHEPQVPFHEVHEVLIHDQENLRHCLNRGSDGVCSPLPEAEPEEEPFICDSCNHNEEKAAADSETVLSSRVPPEGREDTCRKEIARCVEESIPQPEDETSVKQVTGDTEHTDPKTVVPTSAEDSSQLQEVDVHLDLNIREESHIPHFSELFSRPTDDEAYQSTETEQWKREDASSAERDENGSLMLDMSMEVERGSIPFSSRGDTNELQSSDMPLYNENDETFSQRSPFSSRSNTDELHSSNMPLYNENDEIFSQRSHCSYTQNSCTSAASHDCPQLHYDQTSWSNEMDKTTTDEMKIRDKYRELPIPIPPDFNLRHRDNNEMNSAGNHVLERNHVKSIDNQSQRHIALNDHPNGSHYNSTEHRQKLPIMKQEHMDSGHGCSVISGSPVKVVGADPLNRDYGVSRAPDGRRHATLFVPGGPPRTPDSQHPNCLESSWNSDGVLPNQDSVGSPPTFFPNGHASRLLPDHHDLLARGTKAEGSPHVDENVNDGERRFYPDFDDHQQWSESIHPPASPGDRGPVMSSPGDRRHVMFQPGDPRLAMFPSGDCRLPPVMFPPGDPRPVMFPPGDPRPVMFPPGDHGSDMPPPGDRRSVMPPPGDRRPPVMPPPGHRPVMPPPGDPRPPPFMPPPGGRRPVMPPPGHRPVMPPPGDPRPVMPPPGDPRPVMPPPGNPQPPNYNLQANRREPIQHEEEPEDVKVDSGCYSVD